MLAFAPHLQPIGESMTWWKVDDGFHGHPKVSQLFDGDCAAEAIALWTLSGSWCADQLTDGFIPSAQTKRFGLERVREAAAELVRVGLWHAAEGGFQFHDWLDRNPSREKVLAERAAGVERKLLSRARQSRDKRVVSAESRPCLANVSPDPTRPDPVKEEESAAVLSRARHSRDTDLAQRLTIEFKRRFRDASGGVDVNERLLGGAVPHVLRVLGQFATARGVEPQTLVAPMLDRFFADDRARAEHFPPAWLAANPMQFLEPRAPVARMKPPQQPAAPKIPDGVPAIRHWGNEGTG